MTTTVFSKTFFISYLREDHAVASKIVHHLERLGHQTFFDAQSISLGDNWKQAIINAIQNCDYFLLLWSNNGDRRSQSFVPVELNLARERHQRHLSESDPFILPILIGEGVQLPSAFKIDHIHSICLSRAERESDVKEIAEQIHERVTKGAKGFTIGNPSDPELPEVIAKINQEYSTVLAKARSSDPTPSPDFDAFDYADAMLARFAYIQECTRLTIEKNPEDVERSIDFLREWMINETIVRVIGAGRAKLAATLPANRLAHGGARVYEQDGSVPMPHDIKGGGIIAASASGRTPSVLGVLKEIHRKKSSDVIARPPFTVLGIAGNDADEFRNLCDIFIGIHLGEGSKPLSALADVEESVISLVLDALIVSAGWKAGFDDTRWRLGHENLGATGPYDATSVPTQPLHSSHKIRI